MGFSIAFVFLIFVYVVQGLQLNVGIRTKFKIDGRSVLYRPNSAYALVHNTQSFLRQTASSNDLKDVSYESDKNKNPKKESPLEKAKIVFGLMIKIIVLRFQIMALNIRKLIQGKGSLPNVYFRGPKGKIQIFFSKVKALLSKVNSYSIIILCYNI